MDTKFFTIKELATYLRISKDCAYKLAQQGKIPASKVGRKWRFEKDIIDKWIESQQNINRLNRPKKILVVDDNEDIRILIREILEKEFDVIEASEGLESLKLIGSEKPDLIIMDVTMPYKDGYELCEYFKNSPGTLDIPVILITGQDITAIDRKFREVGADDFLTKPFDNNILVFKVKKLIGVI
ncbi:MAG: response regulator [Candidatus Muiribacteriaceae bacterium]